jgi:hypothetical protein
MALVWPPAPPSARASRGHLASAPTSACSGYGPPCEVGHKTMGRVPDAVQLGRTEIDMVTFDCFSIF